ncbi:MAG: hypothetical protein GXO26_08075 [Crenarchaeota archaeon]|nr:hypothetical protein [Thermoproteota archaeon]
MKEGEDLEKLEEILKELEREEKSIGKYGKKKRNRNDGERTEIVDLGTIDDNLIKELEEVERIVNNLGSGLENSLVNLQKLGKKKNYVNIGIKYDTAVLLNVIKLKLLQSYNHVYPFNNMRLSLCNIIHVALLLYYTFLDILPERVRNFVIDCMKVAHSKLTLGDTA